jgi:hypothetical protein
MESVADEQTVGGDDVQPHFFIKLMSSAHMQYYEKSENLILKENVIWVDKSFLSIDI